MSLVKVETREDLDRFIRLPWKINKDNPCWIPPLIQERRKFLNPDYNPFFEHANADLYLAVEGRSPVGRIALVDDKNFQKSQSEPSGIFGMFESVNDESVCRLLLDKAFDWCQEQGFVRLIGPLNLSMNHECGLLVEGFDSPAMLGIPYNPEYYVNHFESWGLRKVKDLLSFRLDLIKIPDYLSEVASKLEKRDRFSIRSMNVNRFEKDVSILWDIYNSAWGMNWGFVPMTKKEFIFAANDMKSFVRPEFCLIAEVDGEPAGFSLALPDVNQVLKKLNGSLFPFGWLRFLWMKKKIDVCRVLTLGVKQGFRKLGIDAYLYHETYRLFMESSIKWCEMSWLLEDNEGIVEPMHRIGGVIYKRHRIYERSVSP